MVAAQLTQPAALSAEEIEQHCSTYLPWVERLLRRELGDNATEYAGEGLYTALMTYDGHSCPLENWIAKKSISVARNAIAGLYGRPDREDRRHQLYGQSLSLQDYDADQLQNQQADQSPGQALDQDESLLTALRQIDEMQGRDRWKALGHVLGSYPVKSAERISANAGLTFHSVDELVDAVMLFGASLDPGRKQSNPRVCLDRLRGNAKPMPWLIAGIEQHAMLQFRLTASLNRLRRRITYRSQAHLLLGRSMARWYHPSQGVITPADCAFSSSTVLAWLVSGLATSKAGGPLMLSSPNMSGKTARRARSMLAHVTGCTSVRHSLIEEPPANAGPRDSQMVLPMQGQIQQSGATAAKVVVQPMVRSQLEAWVSERVSREVWER